MFNDANVLLQIWVGLSNLAFQLSDSGESVRILLYESGSG